MKNLVNIFLFSVMALFFASKAITKPVEQNLQSEDKKTEVTNNETNNEITQDATIIDIDTNCNNLYQYIAACQEYRCITPKPDGSGIPVKHYISGYQESQKGRVCIHNQSWGDGHDILTCEYPDEAKKFVAAMLQKQSQNYEPTKQEFMLMEQIFRDFCYVSEFNFLNQGKLNEQY